MTAREVTAADVPGGCASHTRHGGETPPLHEQKADRQERHEEQRREELRHARALPEGPVERLCNLVCMAALVVMLSVIGLDIATRALLNFSFEISDELGGYMLVVITFVSLPVCQINDSFHHVEFVQARLSARGRAVSHVIFDALALAFCALLLWQLGRFELSSWRFDDHAPTYLATPLWLPRFAMAAGAAALVFSGLRTLSADIARLRACGKDPPLQGDSPSEAIRGEDHRAAKADEKPA
jgi:TRAP-type C4-dicarboxylate transport system permease small subunit